MSQAEVKGGCLVRERAALHHGRRAACMSLFGKFDGLSRYSVLFCPYFFRPIVPPGFAVESFRECIDEALHCGWLVEVFTWCPGEDMDAPCPVTVPGASLHLLQRDVHMGPRPQVGVVHANLVRTSQVLPCPAVCRPDPAYPNIL